MTSRNLVRLLALSAAVSASAVPAMAEDVQGVWMRSGGVAKVKIAPCGGDLCGTVIWLKNPNGPGKVGEKVFFDFAADGPNRWKGRAFNPEDGNTYSGKMELAGSTLVTTGCAMAGLICKSISWTRSN